MNRKCVKIIYVIFLLYEIITGIRKETYKLGYSLLCKLSLFPELVIIVRDIAE